MFNIKNTLSHNNKETSAVLCEIFMHICLEKNKEQLSVNYCERNFCYQVTKKNLIDLIPLLQFPFTKE